MNSNSNHHARRSIRVPGYDYSQPGAYFVTICTYQRACLFGEVVEGVMRLNGYGKIANDQWLRLEVRFNHIELSEFIIMPNHMHGIIIINEAVGAGFTPAQDEITTIGVGTSPTPTTMDGILPRKTLGDIVGAYKSLVAGECLKQAKSQKNYTGKLWQRNYYEHIIRNDDDLRTISDYIETNPLNWAVDELNIGYSPEILGFLR